LQVWRHAVALRPVHLVSQVRCVATQSLAHPAAVPPPGTMLGSVDSVHSSLLAVHRAWQCCLSDCAWAVEPSIAGAANAIETASANNDPPMKRVIR